MTSTKRRNKWRPSRAAVEWSPRGHNRHTHKHNAQGSAALTELSMATCTRVRCSICIIYSLCAGVDHASYYWTIDHIHNCFRGRYRTGPTAR